MAHGPLVSVSDRLGTFITLSIRFNGNGFSPVASYVVMGNQKSKLPFNSLINSTGIFRHIRKQENSNKIVAFTV